MKLTQFAAVILGISAALSASTINVSTGGNASAWSVLAGAGGSGTPFDTGSGNSITSNTTITGTTLPGANIASWNGFGQATLNFSLPSDAISVSLAISNLGADDRMVMRLNGINVADRFVFGGGGAGMFDFGAGDVPYTFTGNTSFLINSGFVIGGVNQLVIYFNNTGSSDRSAPTHGFVNNTDGVDWSETGTVTFSESSPVPEPASWTMLGLGAGLLAVGKLRSGGRL
jgi:PEP-CTERM motif